MKADIFQGKKFFSIFLIINAILWVFVQSFRNLISRDAMEAVIWGNLLSAGTNKHPPFSGWLAGGSYALFGENDVAIYILGQICIIIGLIFIYKLAKNFFDEEKAILSSLIMTPCIYYTYQAFYDNFNCNYISIALWAILAYLFYKAVKLNKITDWVLLGITAGIAVLAKYQVAFLFLGMFLYLVFYERQCFKKIGMYLAMLIATVVIIPHFYWLYQNDFFSFIYLIGRTESALDAAGSINILQRFVFPLKFYLDQLLALAPCFVLYLVLAVKEKNITVKKFDLKDKDLMYILLAGFLPLILIGAMGFFTTSRIVGAWGSAMVSFIGIILFYIFPINITENGTKLFKKRVIGFAALWLLAMFAFVQLQTKIDMGYPHKEIMAQINEIWAENTNNAPLKYVKGHDKYAFHFRLYNPQKPTVILDTFGYQNPWINRKDLKEKGLLIVGCNTEDANNILKSVDYVFGSKSYEIKRFEYEIKNVLNKKKQGEFYYIIIPPEENQG